MGRLTGSECEFVDESLHFVGKRRDPFWIAEPYLEQCAVPDCGE